MGKAARLIRRDGGRSLIYGIRFAELEAHLAALGFAYLKITGSTRVYTRGDDEFYIHQPNPFGTIPLNLVEAAFDAADLVLPLWRTGGWVD